MEPVRSTRGALAWALIAAACGGAALGCNDPRKTAQSIAREEPAALSLGVDNRPGEGPAKAAPPNAAQTAPADGQSKAAPEAPADPAAPELGDDAAGEGDAADEASASSRRRAVARGPHRRRRAASADRGGDVEHAEPADRGGDAGDRGDAATAPLKVSRLVVARAVSGREPVGAARSFTAGDAERLHAFVELTNGARAAGEIFVTFTPPGGGAPHRIKLDVGAERRWRTWATTRRARVPGAWSVTVTDAGGAVLGRTSFTVTK